MLKEERQSMILTMLRQDGKVVAGDLSQRLGVSEDTIRRDLRELADAGHMTRVHGGGLPSSPAGTSFKERLKQSPVAKAAIARATLKHIHNDQVIILDGGTTNLMVAEALPADLQTTIVTNSPLIAAELADHQGVNVIMIGGVLYKSSQVTTGASTVEAFQTIRADVCLLGVCSLHPEAGITLVDYEEVFVKRAMIEGASEVIALASAEKMGTASAFEVAPINVITHLITEKSIPEAEINAYRNAGIQVEQV